MGPGTTDDHGASQEASSPERTRQSRADTESENDEDQENVPARPRQARARPARFLDSDEENDGLELKYGRVLVPDTSMVLDTPARPAADAGGVPSSGEDRPEDGTDKENDDRLMFDRGENKENTV